LKAKRLLGVSVVLGVLLGCVLPVAAQEPVEVGKGESSSAKRPVLLVPGWAGRLNDMLPLEERLIREGWGGEEVMPLEFADPVGSSLDHAVELETALRGLLARTGAPEVDIVAHSMGSLAVWVYLQSKGNPLGVRRVVFLAAPFQGTLTAHLAWGSGGRELVPGSELLTKLKEGPQPQHWVEVLTVRTPLDLTVTPWEGSTLLKSSDHLICCPTHQGLLDHEETFGVIMSFLLHGRSGGETGSRH
jgi:triacylglycerol lipase